MHLSKNFKKNWKKYILLLFGILISLIGLEVYSRLHYYINEPLPNSLFEKDADIGFKLSEGYAGKIAIGRNLFGETYDVTINSKGLRDYEYSHKKPDNTFRILVLGDSNSFGVGVELNETFSKRLEKKLNEGHRAIEYQVINMGIPGYCTAQELEFLKKEGLKYNPDIVLLTFSETDIFENYPDYRMRVGGEKFIAYSFYFLREKASRIIKIINNPITIKNLPQIDLRYYSKNYSKEDEILWGLTKNYLREINDVANKNNISMVIATMPNFPQLLFNPVINLSKMGFQLSNKEQYSEIKPDENNLIDLGNYLDLSKPNKILEDFSEKNSIYFIDLLPYFEKHKNEDLFLLPDDPHFNGEGNKLAADTIYEGLELLNLINME